MSLPGTDIEAPLRLAAFLQQLQELGWTDRRNVQIDYRLAESDTLKTVAAALVAQSPDILVVNGSAVLQAARDATRTIPIVFVNVIDPVGQGFVMSLDHPGGNITGLSNIESDMGGKWLQLLKEIAPQVTDVAVIGDNLGGVAGVVAAIRAAAALSRVKLMAANALVGASEFEHVFDEFARQPNTGLVVLPGPLTLAHRKQIIALAARSRLPAVYPYRYYVTDGGLISYGVDTADAYRRAATYVDRILKGEKPADLPVQRAIWILRLSEARGRSTSGGRFPDDPDHRHPSGREPRNHGRGGDWSNRAGAFSHCGHHFAHIHLGSRYQYHRHPV
jgi:putative tryptophan/tyrosine transport system substrate-binding protein